MPDKKIIYELKKLLRQRGEITREQQEYARQEVKAIMQIHPVKKPSEEIRFSHLRNLRSYIGEHAFGMIADGDADFETIIQQSLN